MDTLLASVDRRIVLAIFLGPLLLIIAVILITSLRDRWRERRKPPDEER